jgi:hypothetical protein
MANTLAKKQPNSLKEVLKSLEAARCTSLGAVAALNSEPVCKGACIGLAEFGSGT